MKKTTILSGLATAALTTMLTVTGVTAASAADCTPSESTPATLGDWARTGYSAWTQDASTPADPDGQSGDDNPMNTVRIGAQETQPSETAVEHSGWDRSAPEGAGWVQVDEKDVTEKEAFDEPGALLTPAVPAVDSVWANFSPNEHNGPFDGPPTYPSDPRGTWQVHDQIPGGHADEPDGVYQQGNGAANGSWFYKLVGSAEVPAVYDTVHHPAVTHEEYRYERTSPGAAEYRWVIEKRTTSEGTDAVVCGTEEPGDEIPNTPPTDAPETPVDTPSTPATPAAPTGTSPTSDTTTTVQPTPAVHHASAGDPAPRHRGHHAHHHRSAAAAVPTVIDAGL